MYGAYNYILMIAATIAIFNGDIKFNRTSLHQMCKTKQCSQACHFWECQHYSATAMWCKYSGKPWSCLDSHFINKFCLTSEFSFSLFMEKYVIKYSLWCRVFSKLSESVVLDTLPDVLLMSFFSGLVFLLLKFWMGSKSFLLLQTLSRN